MTTALGLIIGIGSAVAGLVIFVLPLLQDAVERQLYGGWTRQQLQQLERHQRLQRIKLAQEQVRLRSEVDRCLSELKVEIAQDQARRGLETER